MEGNAVMSENINDNIEVEESVVTPEPAVEQDTSTKEIDPAVSFHDTLVEEDEPKDEPKGVPEENNDHKPWQNKDKGFTPKWARDRFKQLGDKVKATETQNQELMTFIKTKLGDETEPKAVTRNDFPDDESYLEHIADARFEAKLLKQNSEAAAKAEQQAKINEVQTARQKNIDAAVANDLKDYNEVMTEMAEEVAADPSKEIDLPEDFLNHLSHAKVGPYVEYGIASNAPVKLKDGSSIGVKDLLYKLKDNEAARVQVVDNLAQIYEKGRGNKGQATSTPAPETATIAANVRPTKPAVQKRVPKKSPPKVKSGSKVDLSTLSGDAYVKARNEQLGR